MKMNVVDDLINGGSAERDVDPSPSAIGTEFARQYYTLLADSPNSVHKFYSHESSLVLNDRTIVGQQNIGLAIEELVGEKCRIKIVSVKGLSTFNNGIALQIFGEMGGRCFVQTFILGQQGAKKYYVQNDLLHFLDQIFQDKGENGLASPIEQEKPIVVNGSARRAPPVEEKVSSPQVDRIVPQAERPTQNGEEKTPKRQHAPKKEETPKKKEEVKEEEKPAPAPTPAPVDNTPKTWAKLVGGGSSKPAPASPAAPVVAQPKPQPKPTPVKPQANAPAPTTRPSPPGSMHQIYVGGIVRKIVPATTAGAEQELRDAFSKYGLVENVAVPRKVLDNPSDQSKHAFAFVTMKTPEDIQNALQSARKDDRGHHLQIKIDAFGFDGEVLISEQRADRERNGFRSRGGFSGRGNNFNARGRTGRGGFRANNGNPGGVQH